ncbi:MAG: CRTAC1 family protein, partial [bacterium]
LNDSGLFLNNGDGTFRDGGAAAGFTTLGRWAASIDVADVDNDGDYDAFVGSRGKGPDFFFEQIAPLRFREVSAARGLRDTPPSFTFLGSWFDYDGDGDPDLLLNVDWWGIELWRNDEGRFTRVTDTAFPPATDSTPGAAPNNPMGVTWGDLDNDGCIDMFVAGWNLPGQAGFEDASFGPDSPSRLYKSSCDGTFTDITPQAGLRATGLVEWSPVFVDYDNDGDLDLSVIAGNVSDTPPPPLGRLPRPMLRLVNIVVAVARRAVPTRWTAWLYRYEAMIPASGDTGRAAAMPVMLYRNMLKETDTLTFVDVSHQVGVEHVGAVRGSAWADIDNDGTLDWFISGRATPKRLFRNNGPVGHYTRVHLVGARLKDAIGAQVLIKAGGDQQLRHVHVLDGYLSQSQMDPHFGLGKAERVDEILVRWPGTIAWVSVCRDVPANRTVTIIQDGGCRW